MLYFHILYFSCQESHTVAMVTEEVMTGVLKWTSNQGGMWMNEQLPTFLYCLLCESRGIVLIRINYIVAMVTKGVMTNVLKWTSSLGGT